MSDCIHNPMPATAPSESVHCLYCCHSCCLYPMSECIHNQMPTTAPSGSVCCLFCCPPGLFRLLPSSILHRPSSICLFCCSFNLLGIFLSTIFHSCLKIAICFSCYLQFGQCKQLFLLFQLPFLFRSFFLCLKSFFLHLKSFIRRLKCFFSFCSAFTFSSRVNLFSSSS